MIKLNCHPYDTNVWFTTKEDAFYRKRKQITGFTNKVEVHGMCSCSANRGQQVVGLFEPNSSILVHELSHAAINIFSFINMDINEHTTEAFAYLLESLHRQCNDYLNKQCVPEKVEDE